MHLMHIMKLCFVFPVLWNGKVQNCSHVARIALFSTFT